MTGGDAWRPVHVGLAGSALAIGNVEVWRHEWRPIDAAPITLRHPNDPTQTQLYTIYEAGDEEHPIRFAAAQLGDATWAFHIPADQAIVSPGASADRSLRYAHRTGPFRPGHWDIIGGSATLTDAETGTILADTVDWLRGRINRTSDGSLFLRLEQGYDEALFRIDPARRVFRNLGDGGGDRPLAELPGAMKQAREETGKAPMFRRISPDGTILVELVSVEWANSHWVNSPRVTDLSGRRVVLDLWNTDWDAQVSFPGEGRLGLSFRRYHEGGGPDIELDLRRETYRITQEHGNPDLPIEGPLAAVAEALEASSRREVAWMAAAGGKAERPSVRLTSTRAACWWLGAAFLLLVGLALVVKLASGAPSRPEPPLATIPTLVLPESRARADAVDLSTAKASDRNRRKDGETH